MTQEQWEQVKHLFEAALEVDPGSRAAFLEAACQEDSALCGEVERLLAENEIAGSFLEKSPLAMRSMLLAAGTRLGPYEILGVIGTGGMGEVYRAGDTRLKRTVAIKVLPGYLSSSQQSRERFEREARAIASLSHPHICTLHDIGHQDGIDYLVMEYLEGETLAHRLKKGPLPLEQAMRCGTEIADALDTAHKHGVIHRDLKPGNIMLTKTGAKLLDFGLAKLRVAEAAAGTTALATETSSLTAEGAILGTFQYMAPEQLEGREADARTDIFALGAVIYEMATGRKAFEGKSQASLIAAILEREPLPISTLQPIAPSALDHVVRICLAKEPDGRWQAAHDVLVELKWVAAGGAGAQASEPAVAALLRKPERLAWIAAAGLFLALITFTITIIRLRQTSEARAVQFEVAVRDKPIMMGSVSMSPDGQYVAFDEYGTGVQSRVWLHPLNSLATYPMPSTGYGNSPFWSPDSRYIGFSSAAGLKTIRLAGESPQTVCNLASSGPATWNGDGIILFAEPSGPLYKVNAIGGEPKAVTTLDRSRQEAGHLFPQFLPDGRHFIYLAWSTKPENNATYLGSLDSPQVKRIHDGNVRAIYARPGYLIFNRRSSLMTQSFDVRSGRLYGDSTPLVESLATMDPSPYGGFSVSENGVLTYVPRSNLTELVWFDRSGKRLGTVGEPADYSNPAISPDQKMVAVGKRDPETKTRDIWVIDVHRGTSSRFTFDPGDDLNPTWSPDGTRIAFTSDRKGHRDIYVKPASSVGDEQLLVQSKEDKSIDDWSSDGQYLAASSVLFSFREQKALAPLVGDQCHFYPNRRGPPRWFAYMSEESGAAQVYVRSFAGKLSGSGGKWQISTHGGTEPSWRGDGKELFYLSGDKLMAVEVNGDGEAFRAGIPKELFEARLTSELRRNRYVATSDGKRFLMNVRVEGSGRSSFTVILNWQALLKH